MKVFIGFENISSTVTDIQNYFVKNGHECFTALSSLPNIVELNTANYILQKEFDKMPIIKPDFVGIRLRSWWEKRVRRVFFEEAICKYDVFVFLWSTFYFDYSDLQILKRKKKKIVFVFAGDDVRWREAASQEFDQYGLKGVPIEDSKLYSTSHLEKNLRRLRHGEKYADMIFSRLDQGQLQLRPYYRWNMMVDPSNYCHNSSQRKFKPIVVHAPTSKAIKGTKYVLEAFERLKQEDVLFEPILVENVPHLEAVKIFESSDIIIDQLILPGTGKLASEGLAMGKVVISLMGYEKYPQGNPMDCPIVDADTNTIYTVLKELILDHEKRISLAERARPYAEKHLLPKYFCDIIIDVFENKKSIEPEYYPNFFREYFVPEHKHLGLHNLYIDFVREEKWYKEYVKPGERNGLIF